MHTKVCLISSDIVLRNTRAKVVKKIQPTKRKIYFCRLKAVFISLNKDIFLNKNYYIVFFINYILISFFIDTDSQAISFF